MGTISKLGTAGDTKLSWTKGDKESIATARKTFDDLKAKGYSAFTVDVVDGPDGKPIQKQGRRVDAFDEDLGEIVLVPRMVGG